MPRPLSALAQKIEVQEQIVETLANQFIELYKQMFAQNQIIQMVRRVDKLASEADSPSNQNEGFFPSTQEDVDQLILQHAQSIRASAAYSHLPMTPESIEMSKKRALEFEQLTQSVLKAQFEVQWNLAKRCMRENPVPTLKLIRDFDLGTLFETLARMSTAAKVLSEQFESAMSDLQKMVTEMAMMLTGLPPFFLNSQ